MRFLNDANPPYRWDVWQGSDFLHVYDLGDSLSDRAIWQYAEQHDLVILTKDSDFSDWILFSQPPPRVVHFRIGNMRLGKFKEFVDKHWGEIAARIADHRLVIVFSDRIESMS